jgi:hypothetical protein
MKKAASAVLILTMALFLINPLPSEAGGYRGGHGYGGWWVPWAIIGGAAIASHYYYAPYYPYYYAPAPVIVREAPAVYSQPSQPAPPVPSSVHERVFIYPREGQSQEQQAKDRYECHSWAVSQTGYDPTQQSAGELTGAQRNQIRTDYQRAQGACLDGRGYTMR